MTPESNRKITVENLLSLKKAERPAAEFWATFESEMRAKQLAAIVGKRSWSDGISRMFAVVSRHHLPFGAVAALAVTWVGVHYVGETPSVSHSIPVAVVVPRLAPAVSDVPAPERVVEPRAVAVIGTREAAQAPALASSSSHVVRAPLAMSAEAPPRTPFSYAEVLSVSDFRETQADISRRSDFGSDREFETTLAAVRQPSPEAEPLSRLDPVSEERRSRLLGTSLTTYASASSPRTGASERIKEDRMYESMNPYGSSSGMSLEFKF
jgi:hypothetical protein